MFFDIFPCQTCIVSFITVDYSVTGIYLFVEETQNCYWNIKRKNFVLNLFLNYFFSILCNCTLFFFFLVCLFFLLRLHLTQQYFFLEPQEKNLRIQTLAKNVFVIVQLFFFFFGRQVRTSTLKSEQV